MKSFHYLKTKTCTRVNLYGEEVCNLFRNNGWKERSLENADLILVNTCDFNDIVEERSINYINEAYSKKKKNQEVIVLGCFPKINPKVMKKYHRGISFGSNNIDDIAKHFRFKNKEVGSVNNLNSREDKQNKIARMLNRLFFKDAYMTYLFDKAKVYHLNISKGCLGDCTFCAEKFSRGNLKSKKISEVLHEFDNGLESGYKIFSLNGDDTGAFGIANNEDVVTLLEKILSRERDYNIIITEFNPEWLIKYWEKIKKSLTSNKISSLTLPIQTTSDRLLKLMKRPYKVEGVIKKVKEIKKINPRMHICTHLLVGFPSETKKRFNEMLKLIDLGLFSRYKVFPYSKRPRTKAANMKPQVSPEEKLRRVKAIRKKILYKYLTSLKQFIWNYNIYWI